MTNVPSSAAMNREDSTSSSIVRVLVLCTRNSARSQIAEALLTAAGGSHVIAASAGSDPGPGVHPMAVEVLAEAGIDWAGRPARGIDAVIDQPWDAVITVCDAARDACPYMPSAGLSAHWGLEDPAAVTEGDAQRDAFRTTRERLRTAIRAFLAALPVSAEARDTASLRAALDAGAIALASSSSQSTSPSHS